MAWWIYKCNNRQHEHQKAWGDWNDVFDQDAVTSWGSTEYVPALMQLSPGDLVIAHQSERNELVGIARVDRFRSIDRHYEVYLEPLERIGVKIRPLKKSDATIVAIPSLRPGPIKTLYPITSSDAKALLRAAGLTIPESDYSKTGDEKGFLEGEARATSTTVRNAKLREVAKEHWGLKCYCCGFDFATFYGNFASGSAIVHHLETFSKGKRRRSTVDDVRVLCANCHYVIHLEDPPIDVDDLKRRISKSWEKWSIAGVVRNQKVWITNE